MEIIIAYRWNIQKKRPQKKSTGNKKHTSFKKDCNGNVFPKYLKTKYCAANRTDTSEHTQTIAEPTLLR